MTEKSQREIKFKNPLLIYLFSMISFGVYGIVWHVKSKRDLVALGAEIPTSWLLIVPLANLFYMYKYFEGYTKVKGDGNALVLFLLNTFTPFGLIVPYLVQDLINGHANHSEQSNKIEQQQAA